MSRKVPVPVLAFVLGVLASPACRRGSAPEAASRPVPRGDAVWLLEPAAAGEPDVEDRLRRIGAAGLFLPAGQLAFENGRWVFSPAPVPPRPLARTPVVLVVGAGAELDAAVQSPAGPDSEGVAHALLAGLAPALAAAGPYGRVAGVHLDFPFAPASGAASAALVGAVKRGLPTGVFVSISLRASPSNKEEHGKLAPLAEAADALAAFVFGMESHADPVGIDALRRPWWAVYAGTARGERVSAGRAQGAVPERYLDPLSGNPRVQFENDLSVDDASASAFHLVASSPIRLEGLTLEPGDRVAYRLPLLPEMLFQLGSTLAGKRFALGRILVFEGASDAERIFSLAAFEDVLLGRSMAPVLEPSVQPMGNRAVAVGAVNRAHHASMVSRISNWVDVDLAPAHPGDVQLGGFDRYQVSDAAGRPVTPGHATRVRLFETLVAPGEAIAPARIAVRGRLPARCCPYRVHLIAAAGPEQATDWAEPPPTPVPTRPPVSRKRR